MTVNSHKFIKATVVKKLYYNGHFHIKSEGKMFFKIGLLKNFAVFKGKHLRWNLFLIKSQAWRPANLLKGDSSTGVFL